MRFLRLSDGALAVPAAMERVLVPQVERVSGGLEALCVSMAHARISVRLSLGQPPSHALGLKQIHSAVLHRCSELPGSGEGREGDGLWDSVADETLPSLAPMVIRTADCLAITCAARVRGRVFAGTVHAGWRGFVQGIHDRLLGEFAREALRQGIAEHELLNALEVVVSPGIFGISYPCGDDVATALLKRRTELATVGMPADLLAAWQGAVDVREGAVPGKIHPDLQLLAGCEFLGKGVRSERITLIRENTFDSRLLVSYRRACAAGASESRRVLTICSANRGP